MNLYTYTVTIEADSRDEADKTMLADLFGNEYRADKVSYWGFDCEMPA